MRGHRKRPCLKRIQLYLTYPQRVSESTSVCSYASIRQYDTQYLVWQGPLRTLLTYEIQKKYLNTKYRSRSCQDGLKLRNTVSSHNTTTCTILVVSTHFFLQNNTTLLKIWVFRTRRFIHMQSWSCLQNINFKFGALRCEKWKGFSYRNFLFNSLSTNWKACITTIYQKV